MSASSAARRLRSSPGAAAAPAAAAQAPAEAPPTPSMETLPPGAATPDEQAAAYDLLSRMEQDRQARAKQMLEDQEAAVAQAQRERFEAAPAERGSDARWINIVLYLWRRGGEQNMMVAGHQKKRHQKVLNL